MDGAEEFDELTDEVFDNVLSQCQLDYSPLAGSLSMTCAVVEMRKIDFGKRITIDLYS